MTKSRACSGFLCTRIHKSRLCSIIVSYHRGRQQGLAAQQTLLASRAAPACWLLAFMLPDIIPSELLNGRTVLIRVTGRLGSRNHLLVNR